MTKILLATHNQNKLKEYKELLKDNLDDYQFITLEDLKITEDAPEIHDTFEENALAKARFYFNLSKLPTISDDSGLEVKALGNFPGVKSKRWMEGQSYEIKINELLKRLGSKAKDCQYHGVVAYVDQNQEKVFSGLCQGLLVKPQLSNKNAFDYDIGFYAKKAKKLFCELDIAQKNQFSHRSKAFKKLINWLNY